MVTTVVAMAFLLFSKQYTLSPFVYLYIYCIIYFFVLHIEYIESNTPHLTVLRTFGMGAAISNSDGFGLRKASGEPRRDVNFVVGRNPRRGVSE